MWFNLVGVTQRSIRASRSRVLGTKAGVRVYQRIKSRIIKRIKSKKGDNLSRLRRETTYPYCPCYMPCYFVN